MKISIINGPNLNLLGSREPEIYGNTSLEEVKNQCLQQAAIYNFAIDFRQSNSESELIGWIQNCTADAIIINAAAYTHSSIAIHDALKTYSGRIIELHISNPYAREKFRHTSYIAPLAEAIICGMGIIGYIVAIDYLARSNQNKHKC